KRLVWNAMESGMLAQGPRVAELERRFAEYVGVPHAVATSSGTTALHLSLLAAGIGPGDEVITVPFTFIASANAILYAGARPVFVDIREDDFTIDVDQVAAAITQRTRAILPVSLYGHPADLPSLDQIASRHGLALIEDAAQSHGAEVAGRRSGAWGGAAAFSFYPTKNMTTGEGGMITTADAGLADRARLLREHGMRVRYHHEMVGYNFRMTDLHASIGLAQLDRLPGFNRRRIEVAGRYGRELRGVVTPRVRPGASHVFHQYTIRVNRRDEFAARLAERGVGSAIYYPVPVHRQKPYLALGYGGRSFAVTERLTAEVLSIPVHPGLSDADVATVIAAVNETAAELGPLVAEAASR
ncbi:MAG TPA: DegT/DnrJ/EryC1/StrS family aminotransferase, partial [Candidatus Limnocylindria bacterium]|nr:DegT/DnrJ/EryC1/StrS family aminotransferase [Candidatus Limnocylindria bacterium]